MGNGGSDSLFVHLEFCAIPAVSVRAKTTNSLIVAVDQDGLNYIFLAVQSDRHWQESGRRGDLCARIVVPPN